MRRIATNTVFPSLLLLILLFSIAACGLSPEEQEKVNTELVKAAKAGNLKRVKKAINEGAMINITNAEGQSALYSAIARSDVDMVDYLLKKGAAVRGEEQKSSSLLMIPAYNGNTSLMKKLLEKGADPNRSSAEKRTPLMAAAATGKKEAVKLLLENGADVNAADKAGMTALISGCAGMADMDIIKMLIEKEANVNAAVNEKDFSPMMIAAQKAERGSDKHILIAQMLAEEGASNTAVHRNHKVTALTFAVRKGDVELVELLLEKGAKP